MQSSSNCPPYALSSTSTFENNWTPYDNWSDRFGVIRSCIPVSSVADVGAMFTGDVRLGRSAGVSNPMRPPNRNRLSKSRSTCSTPAHAANESRKPRGRATHSGTPSPSNELP